MIFLIKSRKSLNINSPINNNAEHNIQNADSTVTRERDYFKPYYII